ncbi:MAG: NAD(P)-dependent oxidoreductase [Chloroflexota bacterium]
MKILCTGGSGFIGSHLIDRLSTQTDELINIDIVKPKNHLHLRFWRDCNILDLPRLQEIFGEVKPTHVIHLAARATTDGKSIDDFRDNTIGTSNVISAIQSCRSVERVIVTSSQHVRKPGSGNPKNDVDFFPHGFYGESKVITEMVTREANLECVWTIIRPTTVWGPNHPFLEKGLWRLMQRGLYVHPKNDHVLRSYGYVKNIAWLVVQLLKAPPIEINKKVFYLGDDPINQTDWIDAFSMALSGKNTYKVHPKIIFAIAIFGDLLEKIGLHIPMNSNRYFNLTTTNPVEIDRVIHQLGNSPFSFSEGIIETVNWLKRQDRIEQQ